MCSFFRNLLISYSLLNEAHWLFMFNLSVFIVTEYCGNEIFSPTCGHDEVIVMRHALYGRMKLGKCIKRDLGFIGCQTDILSILDTKCSNKHSRTVDAHADFNFDERIHNPCSELTRYFEADYVCRKSKFTQNSSVLTRYCSFYFVHDIVVLPACEV